MYYKVVTDSEVEALSSRAKSKLCHPKRSRSFLIPSAVEG